MRTGFKVRGRKLVSDGERPGIWTTRENADQLHPQRFLNVPPPDGLTYRPGPPQMHSIGARVELDWVMASDTSYAFTDGDTQQRFPVLKRFPHPQLFLDNTSGCLVVTAAGYNYYVDSVNGNDTNNGTTPQTPLKTLAAVPWTNNIRVALMYGSFFSEPLFQQGVTGGVLAGYGNPGLGLPVIDGTDVITGWVPQGTANVWQRTNVNQDGSGANSNRLTVYENDLLMTRVNDIPTCSTTPFSFVDIHGVAGPVTVYINPTANGNPNTNGATYRVTTRSIAIAVGDSWSIDGVRAQRVQDNNGSFDLNRFTEVRRGLAVYGTKHNALIGSGLLEDFITCRADPITSYEPSNVAIVNFTNDAAGLSTTLRRVFTLRDGSGDSVPFIQHDNVGHQFGPMLYEQCGAANASFAFDITGPNATVNGMFMLGAAEPWTTNADLASINYGLSQSTSVQDLGISLAGATTFATITFNDCFFYDPGGSFNGFIRLGTGQNGNTFVFNRCVFYSDSGGRNWMTDEGMTSGTVSFQHCIIWQGGQVFGGPSMAVPTGVTYLGNNNVFVGGAATEALNLSYHGVVKTTLAAWRSATGQDANSISMNTGNFNLATLFSGIPANGDCRLGASGAGAAAAGIGAGCANRWDWNLRQAVAGANQRWPIIPVTLADAERYVRDPASWVF